MDELRFAPHAVDVLAIGRAANSVGDSELVAVARVHERTAFTNVTFLNHRLTSIVKVPVPFDTRIITAATVSSSPAPCLLNPRLEDLLCEDVDRKMERTTFIFEYTCLEE